MPNSRGGSIKTVEPATVKGKGKGPNQSLFLLTVIIGLGILITIANPQFISSRNLINILQQISVTGIATMGVAMVMISGGLDLSIGSIISVTCSVMAKLFSIGMNVWIVVLVSVLVALVCGFINGFIISRSGCAPFIITLGTLSIYQGFALVVTSGRIINVGAGFELLGRTNLNIIPMPVLVFLVIGTAVTVMMNLTRLGRRLFAMGGNEEAAYLSGINVGRYKVLVYCLNALVISVASMVLLSRLGSANPVMGSGYELQSIASAVIGGVTLDGGKGSLVGCFLGVLLLGIISNALNILGVSPFYQNMVLGTIIVIAVVVSNFGKNKR